MAAGRVVFGSDNIRPDIIPDPYTNIHTHQVNRVKKWTRTRTNRVSVGYRVSGGYGTVKYKSVFKLMNNTVYDTWELINITTCEIYKQHHQFTNSRSLGTVAAWGRRRLGTPQVEDGRSRSRNLGTVCWGEGRNATLRSMSPLLSRCSDRDKAGRDTLCVRSTLVQYAVACDHAWPTPDE
jgi:hypothetical protein